MTLQKWIFNAFLLIILVEIVSCKVSKAPFIDINDVHDTSSELEFNLILNQNRNFPILMVEYSRNKSGEAIRSIVSEALAIQKDAAFALIIDCRSFRFDMNNTIGICRGIQSYLQNYKEEEDQQEDEQKVDPFFKYELFAPNPTRIKEKGHLLLRTHDPQNIKTDSKESFTSNYLAKVIKNQIADFVTYIQDQHDLNDFLELKSEFRTSKHPKILYFDQNCQAPLFLRKLASILDGRIKIGVTDDRSIAQKYKTGYQKMIILEYNFDKNIYEQDEIDLSNDEDTLKNILQTRKIKNYLEIKKPRDILLDFQHSKPTIYKLEKITQINQLISHGRVIILEVSEQNDRIRCSKLKNQSQKYQTLFNYVCFKKENAEELAKSLKITENFQEKFVIIDGSLTGSKLIEKQNNNFYDFLPKQSPRQQISAQGQADLCLKTALASKRDAIFYYFNQKSHKNSLQLMKYFNSLPQITSLLYFCQFYLPDDDVKKSYSVQQNTMFVLQEPNSRGQSQKVQHGAIDSFLNIKMFLRQIAVNRMMKIYQEKLIQNEIVQIKTAEQLTKYCFNEKCIIGLLETNKFHQQKELQILREMKLTFSEDDYQVYWIDGICHWEIAKQLKIIDKQSKLIEKSYLFFYREKENQYAIWKGNSINKFWIKKDAFRWVKSLRNVNSIRRLKFGIDIQSKKCIKPQIPKQTKPKEADKKAKNSKQAKQFANKPQVSEQEL